MNNTTKNIFLWLSLILASVCPPLAASEPTASSSLKFWQDAPVNPEIVSARDNGLILKKGNKKIQWDVWGLPIGNGRLGAVFYGNVANEIIQFNEDSLWSGGEGWTLPYRTVKERVKNRNYGSYQPFGDIHITLPHAEYTDYRRELDIANAVGTVSYTSGGVEYKREYFASYPDQVLVVRLTADKLGSISGSIKLTDRHHAKITTRSGIVTARGTLDEKLYISRAMHVVDFGTPEQIANASKPFAGNNMSYEAQMQVIPEGGKMTPGADGELKIDRADSVLILLAADTDYLADALKKWRGADPHAVVTRDLLAAADRLYEDLLTRHVEDYQSLFDRFQFDVGRSSDQKNNLPMDQRIADYMTDPQDPDLVELLVQNGRYLMISSSRAGHGALPANLQGLWNPDRIQAAWSADYHININLQMNYWLTGPGNLSECDEPLFYYMQSVVPVLQRETKARFDRPGITGTWGLNPFGGGEGNNGKADLAWMCMHLYEHYQFTRDIKMLREVSFPFIREVVAFWEADLIEKDGELLTVNCQSPEWGPTEDGVTYAQELIWELFSEYVEISEILGEDKAHRKKITKMLGKLAGPQIGSKGQLMEWKEENLGLLEKQHRHISHLVGLFPGRQISPTTTPELAKAAEVTMGYRGDGGTGWAITHKTAFWARLNNGDAALRSMRGLLKKHIWPNGFSSIQGGDKFQIDANFGISAAVMELFLQSQTGELILLPALPSEWPEGSVKGIRGRGGFLVDLVWKDGELSRAVIESQLGEPCTVRYGDTVVTLELKKGKKVTLNKKLRKVGSTLGETESKEE